MNEVLAQERTAGIAKLATGQLGQQQVTYQPQRHTVQADATNLSTGHKLLSGLANLAVGAAHQSFEQSMVDAYRHGETQRQLGVTEEELDSNWLTRPFTRGGWRDRNYLLVTAEWSQHAREWIARNAHLSPNEMADQLQEQMASLNKHLPKGGMSFQGRAQAEQHLMLAQESLMQFYTEQHQAYASREGSANVNAAMQGILSGVASEFDYSNGLADPTVPLEQLYVTLTNGIENLDPTLQRTLRAHALENLYKDGHVTLADGLVQAFNHENSNTALTLEEAQALGKVKREANEKVQGKRNHEAHLLIASVDNIIREKGHMPFEQLLGYMRKFDELGHKVSDDKYNFWLTHVPKAATEKNNLLVEAYDIGDIDRVTAYGGADSGGNAFYQHQAEHFPETAISETLWRQRHFGAVPSKLKEQVQDSLAALMNTSSQEVNGDPRHVRNVQQVLDGLLKLQQENPELSQNAMTNLLAGLDDESQAVFGHVLKNPYMASENSMSIAIANVMQAKRDMVDGKMNPAVIEGLQREVAQHFDKEWGPTWNFIKNRLRMGEASPYQNGQMMGLMRAQVQREAARVASQPYNAYQPADAIYTQALANVEGRLVTWHSDSLNPSKIRGFGSDTWGVLLPEGFEQQIAQAVGPDGRPLLGGARPGRDDIREALKSVVGDLSGATEPWLEPNANGTISLFTRGTGKDNQAGAHQHVADYTPQQIAEAIQENLREENKRKVGSYHGHEVTVVDPNRPKESSRLIVSGKNSAALPEGDVFDWKNELREFEGFRRDAYKDGAGYSVGIGHHLPSGYKPPKPQPGRPSGGFSMHDIQRWFDEDTDRALATGKAIADEYGFGDDVQATLAVASMVFQMGEASARKFEPTLRQIAAGSDYAGLVARSKSWEWYTGTDTVPGTPNRVEYVLNKVKHRFNQ